MACLRFICFLIALCVSLSAWAQPEKIRLHGKKCMRTSLQHPEFIMADYTLTDPEIQSLLADRVKPKLMDKILAQANESAWPAPVNALSTRMENPDRLLAYVVYEIASVDHKHILIAPKKWNSSRQDGWALHQDLYFIVDEKALQP